MENLNLNVRELLIDKLLGAMEETGDPDFVQYSKMMRERKKANELENVMFRMVSEHPDREKFEQLTDMMKNVVCMYTDVINSWNEEDQKG